MMDNVRTVRMGLASWRRVVAGATARRKTRCAAAGLLLLTAIPASAHTGHTNLFTRIDSIEPVLLPGVVVQVRAGVADQLFVSNTTGETVEVMDADGEPFLRIGPQDVRADVTSPDWAASMSPGATRRAVPRGEPEWRVVARGSSWGWFDTRLHANDAAPPTAARAVTKVGDWTIPMRHGETPVTVKGHVEYRPVLGSFRSEVARKPDRIDVDVLNGRVPGLLLRWNGTGALTLTGIDGEPFARLTPTSTEVNEASATWQEDQRLRGTPTSGVLLDPKTPRWRTLGPAPQLTWLDRRLAYSPGIPPDDALRSPRPTVLVEWDIPVDAAGRKDAVQGTTRWLPTTTQADRASRPWLPFLLVGVVVVVAAVALRRRAER